MSPHGINSLVGDLVEMAKATERLPQLEDELTSTKAHCDRLAQDVQDREISIIRYKEIIEELNAKVRSLEVERDDASFRVMEMEDKTHKVLGGLDTIINAAKASQNELESPQPEPVKEPEPQGSSAERPTENVSTEALSPSVTSATMENASETSSGQSESHPMYAQDHTVQSTAATTTSAQPAEAMDGATTSSAQSDHGPYHGLSYHDYPGFVSRHTWLAGGGTEKSYDWRPEYGIADRY